MVRSSVVGINATSNQPPAGLTSATVSDTPSTPTEPLGTMHAIRAAGGAIRTLYSPSLTTPTTSPTPSIWPWTMWPSMEVAAVTEGSRLTRPPGASPPSVVFARVSGMASNARTPSGPTAAARVRQQPETQIESPTLGCLPQPPGSTVMRRPAGVASTATTRPVVWMMPLNMPHLWPFDNRPPIRPRSAAYRLHGDRAA